MAKRRGKRKAAPGDVATNRQASFRFNLLERFECGIVLTGTEVKSLRESGAQVKDSYAVVRDGEVWLVGLYIAPYGPASRENHDPERPRKLLLHRSEIERLIGKTQERGLTLVPTRIYFSEPGSRAKVELALARGKDLYDKRQAIRNREMAQDVQRELREAQG
jgi:SsrA-binding protein